MFQRLRKILASDINQTSKLESLSPIIIDKSKELNLVHFFHESILENPVQKQNRAERVTKILCRTEDCPIFQKNQFFKP